MDEGTSGTTGENAGEDYLDRGLRDLTEGSAGEARFKEPTAAERAKMAERTRKLYEEEAKKLADAQKRNQKTTQKQDRQAQKKARKAQQQAWGVKRKHRAWRGWAAAVILLGGAGYLGYTQYKTSSGPGGVNDTQIVAHGAVPSMSGAPVSPLNSGPPTDPFSGTPADKWADGAAGIVVPKAKPIGQYSASQVKQAYQTTKQMLIAAALDKQTLNGGAPTDFAELLTQQQRTDFVSQLDKIGVKDGVALSSRGLILSFAPGTTKLIGSVIKVHGTMTARASTDSHGQPVLAVNVNYRVVYPVEPPKAPADWMRVVGQFTGPVLFGNWAEANSSFEPWWQVGPGVAGGRCGTKDGFVHPDYPSGPPDTSVPKSGRAIDPYSLNDNPSNNGGCQLSIGT